MRGMRHSCKVSLSLFSTTPGSQSPPSQTVFTPSLLSLPSTPKQCYSSSSVEPLRKSSTPKSKSQPSPIPPVPTQPHVTPLSVQPKSIFGHPPQQSIQQHHQQPQTTHQTHPQTHPQAHPQTHPHQPENSNVYQPPLEQKKNPIRKTPKNIVGRTGADMVAYHEKLYESGVAAYPLRFARAILTSGITDEQVEKLFVIARNTASATTEVFNSTMIHFFDKPDQVLSYFDLLKSDGRNPDATSYDCLIKAYIKKGLEGKVKETLLKMMSTNGEQPVVLLEKTIAKVLQYFSELGQATSVLELYHIYSSSIPFTDVRTYASIIGSLLKCGYPDEAWALMQAGVEKSIIPFVSTWSTLMEGMRRKNADAALDIYSKMLELKLKPDLVVYLLLIEIYASKSMPDKMLEVYDRLNSEGHILNEGLQTKFFEGLTHTSPVHAVQFLNEMLRYKAANLPTKQSFDVLIGQLSVLKTKEIKIAFEAALSRHGAAFAFANFSYKLIRVYAYERDWVSALGAIDSMLSNGVTPPPRIVKLVVECLVLAGKSTQAKQFVDDMMQKGVKGIESLLTKLPQNTVLHQ